MKKTILVTLTIVASATTSAMVFDELIEVNNTSKVGIAITIGILAFVYYSEIASTAERVHCNHWLYHLMIINNSQLLT